MNLIQRLATRLSGFAGKAESRTRGLTFIANWLAGILWNLDDTWHTLVSQTYGRNPVAYNCVRLLSQSIPEARLTAYQGEGDKRKELPSDHPLRLLFKQPNELMTRFEMDELTTIQMSVVGRSVWWKERSVGGAPIALWPLRPDRVGPAYSVSDRPGEHVLAGWAYQEPDMSIPKFIPRRDAISFNFPDPDGESGGMVEGFGPLSAVRSQIAADNKATDHVGALLANYAQPGVVIEIQDGGLDETEINLMKAKFRQEFGSDNLGRVGVVQAGAKITPLGFTLQQLEFPELRANAEARICGALGVPAILAGVKVGLTESNQRATTQELRAFFAETTLSWYWRRYADQFTNDLAPDFGEDITCEYDTSKVRALAGQKLEALTPIKEAWANGGAMRNEYRNALGLDLLDPEMGEVLFVPSSGTVLPATEKARAAIQKRQEQEQAALAEQQAEARQAELDQRAEMAKLNPPPEVLQLPPGEQPKQLTAGQPEPVAVGANGRQAAQGQPAQVPPARKAGDIVVIPLDEELAAALGVPATGYLVASDGQNAD
ncbi:MAG: phage portal protein [Pseudomonadota bacterium]